VGACLPLAIVVGVLAPGEVVVVAVVAAWVPAGDWAEAGGELAGDCVGAGAAVVPGAT